MRDILMSVNVRRAMNCLLETAEHRCSNAYSGVQAELRIVMTTKQISSARTP
jgi:hypothetical protein